MRAALPGFGFVPDITSNYSELSFAGHESGATLLGLFQVSVLHNLVHLLFGVVGFALARTDSGARCYLVGGGAVYLVCGSTAWSSTARAT